MSVSDRLLRVSMRNALALCLATAIWIAGAVWAYFRLPVALLPDLNFPTLSIVVENDGLTPESLERQATTPVESAMAGVYDVTRVRSETVANLALVTVQFNWGANLEVARQQVMQKIASIQGDLPAGTRIELETLGNTLGQVQGFALSGGASLEDLHDFAEFQLKPLLLQQGGVYDVLIFGGLVKEYAVFLKPSRLVQYGIAISDVRDALVRNNVASAGGILDLGSQSFAVVSHAQLTDARSIEQTVIAVKNGLPVRVRDIGRVAVSHLPYRGGAERAGSPGVVVEIVKQPSADTVAVTKGIDRLLAERKASFPPGIAVDKYYDQSELVVESIRGVEEAVVLGAALVGVILIVFLRSWRAALVAFASIPASLVSALVFMKAFGMSLNVMTLSAMAIATGMVIDDAIVVVENVFRHRALTPEKALRGVVLEATAEVAGPVVSSTITTVAIFVPLAFMTGLAGRLFSPVGVVVSIVMTASLVFALTLLPSIAPSVLGGGRTERGWIGPENLYRRTFGAALRARWAIVLLVAVLCAVSGWVLTRLNREFLPTLDEGSLLMNIDAPPGSSLDETLRVTRLAERKILNDPDVEMVVSKTGHAPGMQDTDTMNHSDVIARLVPKGRRHRSLNSLLEELRRRAADVPGVVIDFTMPLQDKLNDAVSGVGAAVGLKIYGDDLNVLQRLADQIAPGMAKINGVVDFQPSAAAALPALDVALLPDKADRFGITREDLNDSVEAMSYGVEATRVRELRKEVPLMLRYEGTDERVPTVHLDALRRIPLRTADGAYLPLSQVADVSFTDTPGRISHERATRMVTLSCNVAGVRNQDVIDALRTLASGIKMPKGYTWEISGSYAAQNETTRSVAGIAIAAVCLVAAILWIEFRSARKMLLVLVTVPLSTIGASLALWATGQTLNISSLIGLVMLIGVVLRNGIVLIDYVQFSERAGLPIERAVEEGAAVRLRPILMTALSEILGLLPLAFGIGSGAALERPLAIAVIGGLVTSTFLTLYVLPIGYRILHGERGARQFDVNSE